MTWAKYDLARAGLVEGTRKGHFRITERGRKVLEAPPTRIDRKFLRQFEEPSEVDNYSGSSLSGSDAPLTPDEVMREAHRQIERTLADELLRRLRAGSPAFFEEAVVRLLLTMGYGASTADIRRALVGGVGDGGIDGVIDQDALGLDKVCVQAKRYKEGATVGADPIRSFYGGLSARRASKGVFVSASSFTSHAQQTAKDLGIVLIDGQQLARLMVQHEVGCRVVETLPIKKLEEGFFDE